MARVKITEAILDSTGNPVTGATVTVNIRNSTAASLFADETSGTTAVNPQTTSNGTISAWVDEGSYDLVIVYGAVNYTQPFEAKKGFGAADTTALNQINFGTAADTNLYRSSSNNLKTDDNLTVAQNLTVTGTLNATTLGSVLPQCKTYNSATQSITSGVNVVCGQNHEIYDLGTPLNNMHDNNTQNSRHVCRVAGIYSAIGQFACAASASGNVVANIFVNGVAVTPNATITIPNSAAGVVLQVATNLSLAVNDYVELVGTQTSGGALSTLANICTLTTQMVSA